MTSRARNGTLNLDAVAPRHEPDAAGSNPERAKAATRQVVDRTRCHGQRRRRTRIKIDDSSAEIDSLSLARQHAQQREGFLAGLLSEPEAVIPQRFGLLRVANDISVGHIARVQHHTHVEFHVRFSLRSAPFLPGVLPTVHPLMAPPVSRFAAASAASNS